MSEIEDNGEYNSEFRDLHQDRPTQGKLSGDSPIRQTMAKTYSHSAKRRKDKEANKVLEYPEDEEATLPKVKKSTRPLSPRIIAVNHPMRREDNPAFPSLGGPQMPELFGVPDGEMGFKLPIVKRRVKRPGWRRCIIIAWCISETDHPKSAWCIPKIDPS